jgi:hypothetical protein
VQKRQFWGEECDLEGEDEDGGSAREKKKGRRERDQREGGERCREKKENPPFDTMPVLRR